MGLHCFRRVFVSLRFDASAHPSRSTWQILFLLLYQACQWQRSFRFFCPPTQEVWIRTGSTSNFTSSKVCVCASVRSRTSGQCVEFGCSLTHRKNRSHFVFLRLFGRPVAIGPEPIGETNRWQTSSAMDGVPVKRRHVGGGGPGVRCWHFRTRWGIWWGGVYQEAQRKIDSSGWTFNSSIC